MQKVRLFSTLIIALAFIGCRHTLGYNPNDFASEPKDIVVVQVSSGEEHTMILKEDDTLWAVGLNSYGQLGVGSRDEKLNLVQIMTGVDKVSSGDLHTMILKKNGTLWGTGFNYAGQLGDGTKDLRINPIQVKTTASKPMTDVTQVSSGNAYTMIVKKGGVLWAVGLNDQGQLGDGTTTNRWTPVRVKTSAGQPITDVTQVSSGGSHTMIVKKGGALWAVGLNNHGQLGDGTKNRRINPVQVKATEGQPMTDVTQVSSGDSHTMILTKGGVLWAVGLNDEGQLGVGTKDSKINPVQVMTEVAQVSAGEKHTMILTTDDTLWAVGLNDEGQLGDGTTDRRLNPVKIMTEVAQVSAGKKHSMIVKKNGTLWAVGLNDQGQLGNGTKDRKLTPVKVPVQVRCHHK